MAAFRRLANLFRRAQVDREIREELQAHIDMRIEENLARGVSPDAARREALLRFGNATATREHVAAADASLTLTSIGADLRYALRQFFKNPGFAATAVLVLALGIGACVTIFAFVDAALLKPLPYRQPQRLTAVFESMSLGPRYHISYLDYVDWKRMNQVFSSIDLYGGANLKLTTSSGAEPVDGGAVTAGFFGTLGVQPFLGRDFRSGEDLPGAARVALLSYGAWQKRFGGRTGILGQSVMLGDEAYTIIGVLPKDFHFALIGPADYWIPLRSTTGCNNDRGCHSYAAVARLKDGVSLVAAQADMQALAAKLAAQYPDADASRGATVVPLTEVIVGNLRPILLTMMAGAALLLLIACVNVSSLLLVRAQTRRREIAVRGAMGASAARILRQLVTEGLVLVGGGVLLALFAARIAMRLLLGLLPQNAKDGMPYLQGLGMNAHVLVFSGALAIIAVVLFCLVPAMRGSRAGSGPEMREGLASGARGASGTLWRRFGSRLMIAELAVAMVLLVGAGLLTKSFYRLLHLNIGFEPQNLVAMRISAETPRYPKDADLISLQKRVQAVTASLPGVQATAITLRLPVGPLGGSVTFHIVGRPDNGKNTEVVNREVDPGYFPTVGARLLRGRNFTPTDDAGSPPVMIINRAMERTYFAGQDPIGQKITYDATSPAKVIVGIVNDIHEGPLDSPLQPVIYAPVAQETWTRFYAVVRTTVPPEEMGRAFNTAIARIDPALTVFPPQTISQLIHDTPAAYLHRSSAWIVGGFAAMALLLGIVGVYGVIAYSVSQRTREIGVRIALGAQRDAVYKLVLFDAARLTALGIVGGAVASVLATTLMRKLLFQVAPWDGLTLAAVSAGLALLALIAAFVPAHRAATIDPTQALRSE